MSPNEVESCLVIISTQGSSVDSKEREGEGDRERQTDRQTDRDRERAREGEREGERERGEEREREGERGERGRERKRERERKGGREGERERERERKGGRREKERGRERGREGGERGRDRQTDKEGQRLMFVYVDHIPTCSHTETEGTANERLPKQKRMYLRWGLYTLYLFTCQVKATVGEHRSLLQCWSRLSGANRRSSEIQGTALGKSLRAWTCIYRSMPAGVAQSRHTFVGSTVSTVGKMTDTRKQKAEKASEMPIKQTLTARGERADRIAGSPS